VLRCAAGSGAVSCRGGSCRIRPASRAVEWEERRREASMGVAAMSSTNVVLCDDASGASSDPGPGTVPGTRASSGGVLVW
jgi:hypothetical protein